MTAPYLSPVGSKYGAPMGRQEDIGGVPSNLQLDRVPMVDGDYDPGGAYWGGGRQPLWCAWNEEFHVFRRANTRAEARAIIEEEFADVSFLPDQKDPRV